MVLEYLGQRTFNIDGQSYERECFLNPLTDCLYSVPASAIQGDFKQPQVNVSITAFDYKKGGKLKIKGFKVLNNEK